MSDTEQSGRWVKTSHDQVRQLIAESNPDLSPDEVEEVYEALKEQVYVPDDIPLFDLTPYEVDALIRLEANQ